MRVEQIVGWMWIALGVVVASTVSHAEEVGIAHGAPEFAIAVAVGEQALEIRQFKERLFTRSTQPPGVKIHVKKGTLSMTEVASVVEQSVSTMDVKLVEAQRVDGRKVANNTLMAELAKPTAVILLRQGRSIAPQFTVMFKPETLVLRLPIPTTVVPNSPGTSVLPK